METDAIYDLSKLRRNLTAAKATSNTYTAAAASSNNNNYNNNNNNYNNNNNNNNKHQCQEFQYGVSRIVDAGL